MAFVKDFKGLIKGKEYFITIEDEEKKQGNDGIYKYYGHGTLYAEDSVNGNADTCFAMFYCENGQDLYLLRDIEQDTGENTAYFRCLFEDDDKPLQIYFHHNSDLCSHRNWRPCLVHEYIKTQE